MSTRTSRGRISRTRPLTMLPSLKSRYDFASKSCICNIRVSFLLAARSRFSVFRAGARRLDAQKGGGILARSYRRSTGEQPPFPAHALDHDPDLWGWDNAGRKD